MDPVDLARLRFDLASTNAAKIKIDISAEKLQPGFVLNGGDLDRHVVTAAPTPMNHTMVALHVRSMYGGHTLRIRRKRITKVAVYTRRLDLSGIRAIPAVPRPLIPEDPEVGDRLAFQFTESLTLAAPHSWIYTWTGGHWRRGEKTWDVRGMRHLVTECRQGHFTYIPAGHRAHLHVDGVPMPARSVEELAPGDVLRHPGGARLLVVRAEEYKASYQIKASVLTPTAHPRRHMIGLEVAGTLLEGFDRYGSGSLYATEPREGELVGADRLHVGDTVITSFGMSHSAVAEVEDVWRQPAGTTIHVHGTACDGRPVHTQSGLDNRYVVLHREKSFSAFHRPLCTHSPVY